MKSPDSVAWVTYICIVTNWAVFSTALDCTFPGSMDWYFRRWPEWWFLKRRNLPWISVKGYWILSTLTWLGIIFHHSRLDEPVTDYMVILGSISMVGMNLIGLLKSDAESPGAWFFYTDYSTHILDGAKATYSLATWWWIVFRTGGIVKILRNRDKPEMAVQFHILIAGLVMEFVLLVWCFAVAFLPYIVKRWEPRYNPVRVEHHIFLLVMLASWALVIVFGLWAELPNIFFPCRGSTSTFCRILT
ncbi:hypothetical protein HYPSUDRAFT_638769 [Hypholoma sublateritium FD-334 SS-4]|uniref:Uncharacterized protein n=1 Tax=Hypholoma sublateritium (strain FD-334 SS-4) TaxID=945553 RepID=A0A0D2PSS7_HYPSF|nr:hypothetical protein HYPSUDRAFT_638769 [Hypholoma sublateritium FD-334 SS-4]